MFGQLPFTRVKGQAQGTSYHLIYNSKQDYSRPVDSLFRVIDHSMSLWDSTSTISRVNANRQTIRADVHFERVFRKAVEVARVTHGAFDLTVGPLVKAWGFGRKKAGPRPTRQQIDSLRRWVDYRKVSLQDGFIVKAYPQMELDLNGIAQGYTVDVIANFLASQGILDYLVEVGGEVRTAGCNERGQGWQVGIDSPLNESSTEHALQTIVPVSGKAMSTAGVTRTFYWLDGKRVSHIINPITGYPIKSKLLSITLIANDCLTADGFDTALLIVGLRKAKRIARKFHLNVYAVYQTPTGQLKTFYTSGFFGTEPIRNRK